MVQIIRKGADWRGVSLEEYVVEPVSSDLDPRTGPRNTQGRRLSYWSKLGRS